MDHIAGRLLRAVEDACERIPAESVLLSGGVDSALISACYQKPLVTVCLKGATAPDRHSAQVVAEFLALPWTLVEVDQESAVESLCYLMRLTNTFDRGIFNDLATFCALRAVRSAGRRTVASGQGAEILFAGYEFLIRSGSNFPRYRESILERIRLSETRVSRRLGMVMSYPYLSPEVIRVAQMTDHDDCLHWMPDGRLITKVPLRVAAMRRLPLSVAWRPRADVEVGSGFAALDGSVVSYAKRFEPPKHLCRTYWDKTHIALHRIFVGLGLEVPQAGTGMYGCGWCGGGVILAERHCTTCGGFPADGCQA